VTLADRVPDDNLATFLFAPNANTRRIYDRNVYDDETAIKVAPVVKIVGLPVRVASDETTIYPKGFNAKLVDPTGLDPLTAGIWYADVIVSDDPDVSAETLVTLSHPAWPAEETRRVPAGDGSKVNWTGLSLVVPEPSTSVVLLSGPPAEMAIGDVSTTGNIAGADASVEPDPVIRGKYLLNLIIPVGSSGGSIGFEHPQEAPAATWQISHSFGRNPAITVIDSNNQVVLADVEYTSATQVTVTFAAPTSGKVILV
jgi:hypothetical protein